MSPHIAHLRAGEELMDSDTFYHLYSRLAPAPRRRARRVRVSPPRIPDISELGGRALPRRFSPAAAAVFEEEMSRAPSGDAVARLGVQWALSYASAAALLLVNRGMIQGIASSGMRDTRPAVLFPVDASSIFSQVVADGRTQRGAAPEKPLERRILQVLGRQQAREIGVFPVAVRDRIVNLLYVDNGPEALGDAAAAALTVVCTRLAGAYERLILDRQGSSAEPHAR